MDIEKNKLLLFFVLKALDNDKITDSHKCIEVLQTLNYKNIVRFICNVDGLYSLQGIYCNSCGSVYAHFDHVMYHCLEHLEHDYCVECFSKVKECNKFHRTTIEDIYNTYYMDHHHKNGQSKIFGDDKLDELLKEVFEEYK
jgi:hypothetical protein